ncbi:MAG: ABC transporter ATP-binding protein/permease [Firmicutes bacterium]|nr:ABC transporter ATP-binding protein/permease [Bacillota bacterium]
MFSKFDWLFLALATGLIVFTVWLDLQVPAHLESITNMITGVESGTLARVWAQGGFMLAYAFASMATMIIISYLGARVSSSHALRLREKLFNKVGEFSATELKQFSIPSLITRGTNDITQVRTFSAMAIQMLVRAPVMAIWAITRISTSSWQLSLTVIIAVVALIIVLTLIIVIALPRFTRIQKLTDKLNQVTRENVTGIRVVRAYNAQGYEQEKFARANHDIANNNLVVNRSIAMFWPFISVLMSVLSVAIFWVGSSLITNGNPNAPDLGSMMRFSQYANQIIMAFMIMIMVMVFLPATIVSARRINAVLQTNSSITSPQTPHSSDSFTSTISFENVSFSYPNAETPVLTDINLTINQGETVAFIGGTGSGKSTLVNLIPRIYDATEGKITINETCVRNISLQNLNSIVGYVPQTATLFSGTVRSNIAFGDISLHSTDPNSATYVPSDEHVIEALKTAQAWNFVEKLGTDEKVDGEESIKDERTEEEKNADKENQEIKQIGLDFKVSQGGKNFSGGQKQRLSIARVLARKPKILIFDDTFSALDYQTDRTLRTALKKQHASIQQQERPTMLIVAQRIGTIRDCDKIFVLDKGKIVGTGTHNQLMKNCSLYQEIAKSQLSKEEL